MNQPSNAPLGNGIKISWTGLSILLGLAFAGPLVSG